MLVLDASLAMSWCFEDERDPVAETVLDGLVDSGAVVPTLWWLEITNVLAGARRRDHLTDAQAVRFLSLLDELPIDTDVHRPEPVPLLGVALAHGLSAYDASYLELALRRGASLATLDARRCAAVARAGVAVIGD